MPRDRDAGFLYQGLLHKPHPLTGILRSVLKGNLRTLGHACHFYLSKDKIKGNDEPRIAVFVYCGDPRNALNVLGPVRQHSLYLREEVDKSDSSYTTVYFRVPDGVKDQMLTLCDASEGKYSKSPAQKIKTHLDSMKPDAGTGQRIKRATVLRNMMENEHTTGKIDEDVFPVLDTISTWLKSNSPPNP